MWLFAIGVAICENGVAICEKGVAIPFNTSRAPCRSQKQKKVNYFQANFSLIVSSLIRSFLFGLTAD